MEEVVFKYGRPQTNNFECMIWPGNSQDLNMISGFLKRTTTRVWTPAIHHDMMTQWKEE